jgi:hypothetical protein
LQEVSRNIFAFMAKSAPYGLVWDGCWFVAAAEGYTKHIEQERQRHQDAEPCRQQK